jgi:hypothetical protein
MGGAGTGGRVVAWSETEIGRAGKRLKRWELDMLL